MSYAPIGAEIAAPTTVGTSTNLDEARVLRVINDVAGGISSSITIMKEVTRAVPESAPGAGDAVAATFEVGER